jgi:hypothetical protein
MTIQAEQGAQTQTADPSSIVFADAAPATKPAGDTPAPETTDAEGQEDGASLLGDIDASTDLADESGDDGADKGETEQSGEPIVYDLQLPDNAQIDDTVLADVKEFAEANKLSQEAAQQVVEKVNRAAEGALQKAVDQFNGEAEKNRQALLKHPTLGGDNIKQTDQLATAVLKRFAPDGLMELIRDGKHHVNPLFVEFLVSIGKASAPDTLHLGKSQGGMSDDSPEAKAARMFPV